MATKKEGRRLAKQKVGQKKHGKDWESRVQKKAEADRQAAAKKKSVGRKLAAKKKVKKGHTKVNSGK
ncbi:MAG: hypothetical protein WC244_04860 [Patescibacteria group bacterium]|jgi:hypothetical protein